MRETGPPRPVDPPPSPGAGLLARTTMGIVAFVLLSIAASMPGVGRGTLVTWLIGLGCGYVALTGRGISVADRSPDGSPRRSGLTFTSGALLFIVVTGFISVVSNPRFPNERGDLPGYMPVTLLLLVAALGVAAWRHEGWRRVGKGFVAGYVVLTLGQCTGRWTEAADALLPDLPKRSRPFRTTASGRVHEPVVVGRDNAAAPQRHLTFATPHGAARLAAVALTARRCAFAWRDSHPASGFPATRDELLAGPGCASGLSNRAGDWTLSFGPPSAGTPRPVRTLRVAVHPAEAYGGPLPRFEIDQRGIVLKFLGGIEPPRIVASPVPAIRRLVRCAQLGLGDMGSRSAQRGPATGMLPLPGCAGVFVPVTGPASRAEPAQVLTFSIDANSQLTSPGPDSSSDTYVARLTRADSDTARAFTIDVRPVGGGRRYFVDGTGNVHVTAEPRAATANDPLVTQCDDAPQRPCTAAAMQPSPAPDR